MTQPPLSEEIMQIVATRSQFAEIVRQRDAAHQDLVALEAKKSQEVLKLQSQAMILEGEKAQLIRLLTEAGGNPDDMQPCTLSFDPSTLELVLNDLPAPTKRIEIPRPASTETVREMVSAEEDEMAQPSKKAKKSR